MILLTATETHSKLTTLSEKIAIVIGVAKTNGISRIYSGFFMHKIQFYIIMSNWVGQSKDWLDSFVPVRQFCSVRLHNWRYVVGLKTLQTEAVMPTYIHAQNPLNKSVSDTENQLIEISNLIGSVADSNASFTSSLVRFIDKLGKPLDQITLAELAAIIKQCNDAFNAGIEPNINQVKVSPTKAKSLHKQHEIIGYSLDSFCLEPNEIHRACTKSDALELLRMLDDLPRIRQKTSRFNILTKSKELIAERVPYEQAIQYQDVIVKFAGMEYSL